jgi:glycosyltransferase involved in cell wall biosynthesis
LNYSQKVSIIVNNYNYERFLKEAIDSALHQTFPNVEVIVVDDGSTDNSRKIIASYGERVISALKENGGQASTFNEGFKASSGNVICFLDADDKLLPAAVESVLPRFKDEEVVKVHWRLQIIDENNSPTGKLLPDKALPEGNFRDDVIHNGPDSYLSSPTSGNAWSRKVLEKVLPIPEEDFRQGADGYLLTLTPLFGSIRCVEEPLAYYRMHGGNQFWCHALDERISRSLTRYEKRSRVLSERLQKMGISADPQKWRQRNVYYQWMQQTRQAIEELKKLIPESEKYILVDENQWGSQPVTGRSAVPFMEMDGQYWGAPPDDETAIREIKRLQDTGATFVVVSSAAFWWMEYYTGLKYYLYSHFRCVLENDRLVVFNLRR